MNHTDYDQIINDLKNKLETIKNFKNLEDLKREYLGRKGIITRLFKEMAALPIEEKKERGKELNALKNKVEEMFTSAEEKLSKTGRLANLKKDAESLDLNIPKIGHLHPITQIIRQLNQLFIEMGYSIMDGPEIETDEFCFQNLNVPLDHPARDMQDTIYIEEPNILLRTQTSSIEARAMANYKPPMKVVSPGKVYRNEKVNPSNHLIFYHYQAFVVMEQASLKDLFGTFNLLFQKMYGDDVVVRYRNKYYPEVEPGIGPDMRCFKCQGQGCNLCKGVGWIEMGGAGIIHKNVLSAAGIDPNQWMGFAFALGLDRWVMAKYKIDDIRTLFGGNLAYRYH